jgi:Zn-finger nucleic acid-binding protein
MSICDNGNHFKTLWVNTAQTVEMTSKGIKKVEYWWCERCQLVWGDITLTDPTTGKTTTSTSHLLSKS